MARKLKTYQTSIGFFDLAVAAPSMKAALEAWGSTNNLFHQGFAKETRDPSIIAATMVKPGVVVKRPIGSTGAFKEHAALPTEQSLDKLNARNEKPDIKSKQKQPAPIGDKATKTAALAVERAQKKREVSLRSEKAARDKDHARRQRVISKAEGALERARLRHEAVSRAVESERAELESRSQTEDARWYKEKAKLGATLRRASDSE